MERFTYIRLLSTLLARQRRGRCGSPLGQEAKHQPHHERDEQRDHRAKRVGLERHQVDDADGERRRGVG